MLFRIILAAVYGALIVWLTKLSKKLPGDLQYVSIIIWIMAVVIIEYIVSRVGG